ncbi:sugar transferase [Bacillus testis]|uniref:sugar transferase n=1 Tax=Bacillus testis TaxID=1622072 RepID=UPI00067E7D99|nr:exopolysaccharide biosynthesis polyprenyl glycosylphosphotransferase [Bacillus testis]
MDKLKNGYSKSITTSVIYFANSSKMTFNEKLFLFLKRLFDICCSAILIVFLSPLLLPISLLIKIDSPGKVFYLQERIGYRGKEFNIIKFRTMITNAEKNGPQWANKNDERITRVGRVLRKIRGDELPQLLNIIKGEMSFVGPRPERLYFIVEFTKKYPQFCERLQVKPGLTGWAQVNGGYEISVENKLKLDLFYLKNKSLLFDLFILLRTIKVCITGNGAR